MTSEKGLTIWSMVKEDHIFGEEMHSTGSRVADACFRCVLAHTGLLLNTLLAEPMARF